MNELGNRLLCCNLRQGLEDASGPLDLSTVRDRDQFIQNSSLSFGAGGVLSREVLTSLVISREVKIFLFLICCLSSYDLLRPVVLLHNFLARHFSHYCKFFHLVKLHFYCSSLGSLDLRNIL